MWKFVFLNYNLSSGFTHTAWICLRCCLALLSAKTWRTIILSYVKHGWIVVIAKKTANNQKQVLIKEINITELNPSIAVVHISSKGDVSWSIWIDYGQNYKIWMLLKKLPSYPFDTTLQSLKNRLVETLVHILCTHFLSM